MKIRLSFSFLLLLFAMPAAVYPQELKREFINIGTHNLEILTNGKNAAAVVFETGIAAEMDVYLPLINRIADSAGVLAYNRSGYGISEKGEFPRGVFNAAAEFERLVDSSKIPVPFVLVGHSLGALYALYFAYKNPEKIKGLILLDPPPEDWITGKEFADLRLVAEKKSLSFEETAEKFSVANDSLKAVFYRTIASEHRELFISGAEAIKEIRTLGTIPITVVSAGLPNPLFGERADEFQKFWISQCGELSKKSSNGKFILAGNSSNLIYKDDPDLVIRLIEEYLKEDQTADPQK